MEKIEWNNINYLALYHQAFDKNSINKYHILHLFIYPQACKQKRALLVNCDKYLKFSLLKHGWLRRDAEVDSFQWCSSFKINLLTFYDDKFQAYAKVEYHNEHTGVSQGLLSAMINFWSVSFCLFSHLSLSPFFSPDPCIILKRVLEILFINILVCVSKR